MQIRILGPMLYTVVGCTVVEVERIDPDRAEMALRSLGYRDEAAVLIAHHKLDTSAAIRLGQKYGLLAAPAPIPTLYADVGAQARADVLLMHLTERKEVARTH